MAVELATKSDIQDIMGLIELCKKDLEKQAIYQWNDYYPTEEHIKGNIDDGTFYILKYEHASIGTVSVTEKQPLEYGNIDWEDKSGDVVVITKLMVHPEFQKRGCGRKLMDFAEDHALSKNYSSIRLDAYTGNQRAIKLYEARGYNKIGQIMFPERELPFYCYEKLF